MTKTLATKDIDVNILFPNIVNLNDSFSGSNYIKSIEKTDNFTVVKMSSRNINKIINMNCPKCKNGTIKSVSYDFKCDEKYILPPGAYDNHGIHPNMGCDSCFYYFEILV